MKMIHISYDKVDQYTHCHTNDACFKVNPRKTKAFDYLAIKIGCNEVFVSLDEAKDLLEFLSQRSELRNQNDK